MDKIRVIPTQFESEGEIIRGDFVIPKREGPFPGICKFHGLPGSNDQVQGAASILAEAGFAVLTFDFRGFRKSEGIFRLSREVTDSINAITHLEDSNFTRKGWVGVYAASYGAAVAINAAIRDKRISALCIRAPVYDTLAFANSPFIQLEVERLVRDMPDEIHGLKNPKIQKQILDWMKEDGDKYNPIDHISNMPSRPFFIITGDADKAIDVPGVKKLFGLAPEPKKLIIVKGADHELTDTRARKEMTKHIVDWFDRQKPT